jgi:glycosyltransferase involved in cell wall biosynthesis
MLVLHVITGLTDGGAESVLFRLCVADTSNRHLVISLRDLGKYGEILRTLGVVVHCLEMDKGKIRLSDLWKLGKLIRSHRPDLVQTWLYHADFIGGIVARIVGIRRVYWGLRSTNLVADETNRSTRIVIKLNALLSFLVPKKIISCSVKGVEVHQSLGYRKDKFSVVPNGYDLHQFAPDAEAGHTLRLSLEIPDGIPLLGMVARFDPQKDHLNLIKALGMLKQSGHAFFCVLIGSGMNEFNIELLAWLDSHGVRERVYLLGQRNDVPVVMNMLDLHILPSAFGEAFPNVLCEAMSCGTPCIATDVGDSALIIGETGWIVPINTPLDLSRSISIALDEKQINPDAWALRKSNARQRILERFSIEKMVENYHLVWES